MNDEQHSDMHHNRPGAANFRTDGNAGQHGEGNTGWRENRRGGNDRGYHGQHAGRGGNDRRGAKDGQRGGSFDRRGGPAQRNDRREPRRPRVSLPRVLAWEVLRDVELNDAYANLLLPAKLARTGMTGPDAALTTELTYGTLRARAFYDAIITQAANRAAETIDAPVLAAMRLGAHQLLGMRVADHAAVSETVGVIKAHGESRAAGFVNAVLRRITEHDRDEWLELVTAGKSDDERRSIETSHPAWIVRALKQALAAHGRDTAELDALLEADNTPANVCLTALPGLADRDKLASHVGSPTPLSPLGVYLEHGNPGLVPEVADGRARVQDEGSQLVALALTHASLAGGLEDDFAQWLDLCAGPGGKTAILGATAAQDTQHVDAVDASAHRAALVEDSTRAFPDAVEVYHADGQKWGKEHAGMYSRVLVDVPCTGLGALRRRPEARWRRTAGDVGALGVLQRSLLKSAYESASPGGVVAYTTCSPHLAETILVVDEFAARSKAEVLDAAQVLAEVTGKPAAEFASAQIGEGCAAQLWPHLHQTDGMFIALLRKPATAS